MLSCLLLPCQFDKNPGESVCKANTRKCPVESVTLERRVAISPFSLLYYAPRGQLAQKSRQKYQRSLMTEGGEGDVEPRNERMCGEGVL